MSHNPFEYYATPQAFTRYLFREMAHRGQRIHGTVLEPCVGDGAIRRAAAGCDDVDGIPYERAWVTNDLDRRWPANSYRSAARQEFWLEIERRPNWVVSNPPFSPAIEIIEGALRTATVGVAMHLRASIHEVLKTGKRRTWMRENTPTGCLWLPRFAYQRSPSTGKWTTDSVCACWLIWLRDKSVPQFFDYAPEWVLDDLDAETASYRAHMDQIMAERQEAVIV
jgi:hypothetical protein